METILIIEDDPKIAHHLKTFIEKYGLQGVIANDFDHIIEQFHKEKPDLVLLDINLPKFDGYYWCRQIRLVSICPIIFISARTGEMDQVMALENGGDDFITKPFHADIVMAKIRSQLRRAYGAYSSKHQEQILELKGLSLYPERLELHFAGQELRLTKKETDILEHLIDRYPRVAGREDLLERLWDDQAWVDENTLNVNIARVRKKLQELGIEQAIETVRGTGYLLNVTWGSGKE
ncbi:response regulator transcription factor [Pseudobacillus badius]|uniref:response regulator transcription factor n=1 Tax=Bacillus badius TaxID=1455 RepID=UPI0005972ED8|nr:response regulator transcription factor [Bacillus badius]KIL72985.1 Two-component response regulator YvcP [Bacillus badius]KZR58994.1 DNA-binding response regulator [Bacillus badius]